MKRKYDYRCDLNGVILEAEHDWSIKLQSWGELTDLLGIDPGDTPMDTPIRRLIGSPTLLTRRSKEPDGEGADGSSQTMSSGFHPIGCLCGCFPTTPGDQAFQQELYSMMINGEDSE